MLNFTDPMRQLACSPDDAMGVIEIDDLTAIDYAPASTVLSGFCTVGYDFYYDVRDIDFVSNPAPSVASGLVCGCIAKVTSFTMPTTRTKPPVLLRTCCMLASISCSPQ
jgi:hypothetical protein